MTGLAQALSTPLTTKNWEQIQYLARFARSSLYSLLFYSTLRSLKSSSTEKMSTSSPPRKTLFWQKNMYTTTQTDSILPLHSPSITVTRSGSCLQSMVHSYSNPLAGDLMKTVRQLQNDSRFQVISAAMMKLISTALNLRILRESERNSSNRTQKLFLLSRCTKKSSCVLTRSTCSCMVTLIQTLLASSTFSW